jgi:GxxExxY protein
LYKDVTSQILEAAIEVHRVLGPGFLEGVYEEALAYEFDLRGVRYERQKTIPVPYKDIVAGEHRLDLLVEDVVIVELKTVKDFEEIHLAQVMSYLKATGKRVGLLINFAKPRLIDGVKRIQK